MIFLMLLENQKVKNMDETKEVIIEAGKLRKAYRKTYESISKDFNKAIEDLTELSNRFYELSKKMDEFLNFIQKLAEGQQ